MSQDSNSTESGQKSWLDRFNQMFSSEPQTVDDLLAILRDAEQRDVLSSEALGIVEGALQVFEQQVREIMIPRSRMVVVRATASPGELLQTIIEYGHSRFPVIGEGPDEVLGILLAKDLLPQVGSGVTDQVNIKDLLRPATFVPESKRLNVLLREFRSTRNHMAIVVDEYGGVAGLVTIEDVLEEIVGDIADEYDVDDEEASIRKFDEGNFTVRALTPIDEFNRYFECDFSDTEFDTIGGIVMQKFGHLPRRNESVEIDGFRFKVLNADSRRIQLLRVTPLA